jgi:TfoX/Sxy family transcriptional regulator of competence genes
MPYDEQVANRVRQVLSTQPDLEEKKMFGGLAFMLHGNMCCGVQEKRLMVRVGPDAYDEALQRPHAAPMDFTGRPLTGFVYGQPEGIRQAASLRKWVDEAVQFALSLPPK